MLLEATLGVMLIRLAMFSLFSFKLLAYECECLEFDSFLAFFEDDEDAACR